MERVAPESGGDAPPDRDAALIAAGGAAGALILRKERIIESFRTRVSAELSSARAESASMIIDTLPVFVTRLGLTLAPDAALSFASEHSNVAHQHGNERATLTHYSLEDVIREYRILREVIVQELRPGGALTDEHWDIIHRSIDEAVVESASTFVNVQTNFRERFIAALSHDFRGPLASATNYLELLARDVDAERRAHFVSRAVHNLGQLNRMIHELLDLSRAQANAGLVMQFVPCEAGELARLTLEDMKSIHGERFVLDAAEEVHGFWDPHRLSRALHNLVENAVKYGCDDSPITVCVRSANGRSSMSVHNDGEPIPAEVIPGLFVAFQRHRFDQSSKPGWGLGLMHVQAIAQAHGGSVAVESSPELGTTFTIDLLNDPREWSAVRAAPRALPAPPG